MFAQMQVTTIIPSLAALLEHPEFQKGLAIAQKYFLADYEPVPLTLDEMIEEVETNLSCYAVEMEKADCHLDGDSYSYFYYLGFVFGTINEGLTYASPSC